MGSHTNFYLVILSLLRLREEFYRIKSPKLQTLIQLLKTKEIKIVDESEQVPSNKELAAELGIPVTKCNSLIKLLFEQLWEDFALNEPLEVNEITHEVIIMLHWEELKKIENDNIEDIPMSLSINLRLKETPSIGDNIEFDQVPGYLFERGIVHDVSHIIKGKTQHVKIYAHPWENDYDRWQRLRGGR